MGDNKISEASLPALPVGPGATQEWHDELVREAYSRGLADGLRADRAPMAADHLQGEAVPVARLPDYVRSAISGLAHIAMKDAPQVAMLHVGVIDNWLNSTHPQPAELSEVSGNSGELGALRKALALAVQQNSHDMLMTGEEIRLCEAALAATGKQQVGEVQGDALVNAKDCDSDTEGEWYCEKHPDALMGHGDCGGAGIPACARLLHALNWLRLARQEKRELHAQYGFLAEAALASRQPVDISPVATRKLGELAAQGYVTNGVAIFNPSTGQRGLVDNLGYVGWQGAQDIDLGYIRAMAARWRTDRMREGMGWQEAVSSCADQLDVALALLDGRDAGTGVGNIQPPRDLRTKLGDVG